MRTICAARASRRLGAVLLIGAAASAHATCTTHMPTFATATSATAAAGVAGSSIAVGKATTLELVPVATIRFPARPEKTGGPYAGMFSFDVSNARTFRIALGAPAWIDVVEGRAAIASITHGHGAACSGIAKEVTFPLTTGQHLIEITASAAPTLALRIEPAE